MSRLLPRLVIPFLITVAVALRAGAPDDLSGLGSIKDAAERAKRIAEARARLGEIEDSTVRGLAEATLDALQKRPAESATILENYAVRRDEIVNHVPETLFLAGLTACKTPEETVAYARRTYAQAEAIKDPVLSRLVRFSLSKLEDNPAASAEILRSHLRQVGERFLSAAEASYAANDAKGTIDAVQIAIRCDPANVRARFLFAHILQSSLNDIPGATQTLRVGLAHIALSDKDATAYLDRYFKLLSVREADAEIITEAGTLLGKDTIDKDMRVMLATHFATALYWTGRHAECETVITKNALMGTAQGRILAARNLFDGKRVNEAVALLDKAAAECSGADRDAVLGQLQRFWTELGKDSYALAVADQRIAENATRASTRVHRLWILERQADTRKYEQEVALLFKDYGADQGVLLGLAHLAAERGKPDIALQCLKRAFETSTNKPLFAMLAIEAHVNAREYSQAVDLRQRLALADRTFFKDNEAASHALMAAAKFGRGDAVSKSEAERHVKAFLDTPKLAPDSYLSCARLLRKVERIEDALRVLQAGRAAHPWNNQIRADYAMVRLLAGQTGAYGTRPAVFDELVAIDKGRRVHPRLWDFVATWLDTEARLSATETAALREILSRRLRPDLLKD